MTKTEVEKFRDFIKRWSIYGGDSNVTVCLNQLGLLLEQMPIRSITCISCGKNYDDVKTILCEHCSKDSV